MDQNSDAKLWALRLPFIKLTNRHGFNPHENAGKEKKHQHGGPYVPWRFVSLPECIFLVKTASTTFLGNESGMNLRYVRNLDLPLHPGL